MTPFESLGFFGYPGGQLAHPGLFRFDPLSGSSVKLARPLSETTNREQEELLHGVILDPPSGLGSAVSLLNVFRTHVSYGSAGPSEVIHAPSAYVGNVHLPAASFPVDRVEVELSHLDRWLDLRGLRVNQQPGELVPSITYERPEPANIATEGCQISFAVLGRVSARHREISVTEETRLSVQPVPGATADQVDREYLTPVRQFLSLAVNDPVHLRRATYWLDSKQGSKVERLLQREATRPEPTVLPGDALFEGTAANIRDLLPKWLGFARSHRAFAGLFFALLADPPRYVEWQFMLATEALQVLAGADDCQGVGSWLGKVASAQPIVVDAAVWTRALFARRAALWSENRPGGKELFRWTEQIRWLLRAVMLEELGQPVPDSNRDFSRCPRGVPSESG